jgi:hypothetical protein
MILKVPHNELPSLFSVLGRCNRYEYKGHARRTVILSISAENREDGWLVDAQFQPCSADALLYDGDRVNRIELIPDADFALLDRWELK